MAKKLLYYIPTMRIIQTDRPAVDCKHEMMQMHHIRLDAPRVCATTCLHEALPYAPSQP